MGNFFKKIKDFIVKHKKMSIFIGLLVLATLAFKILRPSSSGSGGGAATYQVTPGSSGNGAAVGSGSGGSGDGGQSISDIFKSFTESQDKKFEELQANQSEQTQQTSNWISSLTNSISALGNKVVDTVTGGNNQVVQSNNSFAQRIEAAVTQGSANPTVKDNSSQIGDFLKNAVASLDAATQGYYGTAVPHLQEYYHSKGDEVRANVIAMINSDPNSGYTTSTVDSGQGYKNVIVKDKNGVEVKF